VAENNGAPGSQSTLRGVEQLELLGVHAKRVERPANEKEAQSVLAAASAEGLSVLPCGGGTAMGAGVLPETVDMAFDTTALDRVLAFDSQNLNLAVLAGMTIDGLNRHLAGVETGFYLPLDPPLSRRATIGGTYASNGSGPMRLLYGTVRDLALGVRGIDAQGREVGFGGKTVKNVSGLDMTRFLVGSAGSLGVITSISFRVLPMPEAASLCELSFRTEEDVEKFLSDLRKSVLIPSAVVLDDSPTGAAEGFRVLAGFEGHPKAVERQTRELVSMAQTFGGAGEAQPGREPMIEALRLAVDPQDPDVCPLTLKVSVPIARGTRTCAALRGVSKESGVATKTALLAGNGVVFVHATEAGEEALIQLIRGVKELVEPDDGHVAPVRASRAVLSQWGPRVDSTLERLVLRPVKEKLDPAGMLPPII
jgi:glycolate oxidase FAD binding subunit